MNWFAAIEVVLKAWRLDVRVESDRILWVQGLANVGMCILVDKVQRKAFIRRYAK